MRNREAMHDAANIDIIDFSGVRVELDRSRSSDATRVYPYSSRVCVCVYARARA